MEYRDLLIEGLKAERRPTTPEEILLLDCHIKELAELLADHILAVRADREKRRSKPGL